MMLRAALSAAIAWAFLATRHNSARAGEVDILLGFHPALFPGQGDAPPGPGAPCEWNNVTCDAQGRVTALELQGRGITQLPKKFEMLAELRALNVADNRLSTLPLTFSGLRQLRQLDVSRNLFAGPTALEVLGDLSVLEELHLTENNLTTLPTTICQLNHLRYLHLEHCGLISLPPCIGQLSQLRELHMSFNLLTSLPDSIGDLSELRKLHVYKCRLQSLPETIGGLSHLNQLFLEGNVIKTLPDSFENIRNLTDFRYDGCIDDHEQVTCASTLVKMCPTLKSVVRKSPFRCGCDPGYYDDTHGQIVCFDDDSRFSDSALHTVDAELSFDHGCSKCPDCVSCHKGSFALNPGMGLRSVSPPALVSPLTQSIAVFRCPIEGTCVGGNETTTCLTGYRGALCGACADGYGRQRDRTCAKCDGVTSVHQNRVVYGATFAGICALAMAWCFRDYVDKLYRLTVQGEVVEHGKIVVGFFQVVSPLGDVLSIPLEDRLPMLHRLIHLADPLFLSLDSFLQLHCLPGLDDFHTTWLLSVIGVPVALAVLVFARYKYDSRNGLLAAKERARTLSFVLCFLMYPRVSKEVFEMLVCEKLSSQESWLQADYSVNCTDGTYAMFRTFALVMVCVVSIGVPLALLIGMADTTRRSWRAFDRDGGGSFVEFNYPRLHKRYHTLLRPYRPGCAYYEMVDWLRKMLLGGLLMLLHRGSILQAVVGATCSFLFFVLHLGLRPYRKVATNWLKACAEVRLAWLQCCPPAQQC